MLRAFGAFATCTFNSTNLTRQSDPSLVFSRQVGPGKGFSSKVVMKLTAIASLSPRLALFASHYIAPRMTNGRSSEWHSDYLERKSCLNFRTRCYIWQIPSVSVACSVATIPAFRFVPYRTSASCHPTGIWASAFQITTNAKQWLQTTLTVHLILLPFIRCRCYFQRCSP